MKLRKLTEHDTDPLEAGHCSFHGSWGHVILHCWVLKRHLKDVVQYKYLDKFILKLEKDPKIKETPIESVK